MMVFSSITYAAHVGGYGVFDGNNDYVNVGNLYFSSPFTMTTWVKFDSISWTSSVFSDAVQGAHYSSASLSVMNSPQRFNFNIHTSDSATEGTSDIYSNTISTGQWYFVACVYDGSYIRLYLNGVENANKAIGAPWNSPYNVYIGTAYGVGNQYSSDLDGNIDEMTFYQRVLSPSEIQQAYNDGLAGKRATISTSNRVAYWPMDTNFNDYQNSYHGTAGGNAHTTGEPYGKSNGQSCSSDSECLSGDCNPSPSGAKYCTASYYECAYSNGNGMNSGSYTCYNNDRYYCQSENYIYMYQDCGGISSSDSDGRYAFETGGYVTDYTGCSGTTCSITTRSDYCSGDTVYDYYASGSSYGTDSKNCNDYDGWYGSAYCQDGDVYQENRDYYCYDTTYDYCAYTSSNDLKEDCGVYACDSGSCYTSCTANSDCVSGYVCYSNSCSADDDGDLYANSIDNCASDANPLQDDYDSDGIGDLCDQCPYTGAGTGCIESDAQEITSSSGGTVAAPSGDLEITVPANAMDTDDTIIIEDTGDWKGGYGGTWYGWTFSTANRLGPAGKTFNVPVEVCFTFNTYGLGDCASNVFTVGKDSNEDYLYENRLTIYENRLTTTSCTDLAGNQMKLCAETTSFSDFMVLFDGCAKGSDETVIDGGTFVMGEEYIFTYDMNGEATITAEPGFTVYPAECGDALGNTFTSSFTQNATYFCVNNTLEDGSYLEFQNITYTSSDMHIQTVVGSGAFCTSPQYGSYAIPEFSTVGIILAMVIIALGVVIIKKRE